MYFFYCKNTFKWLTKLKPNNMMRPDKISAVLVNDCANVLSYPKNIFNLALKDGIFPSCLQKSRLPVFKNGEKSSIDNYMPITITNNLWKAFTNQYIFMLKV